MILSICDSNTAWGIRKFVRDGEMDKARQLTKYGIRHEAGADNPQHLEDTLQHFVKLEGK